MSMVACFVEVSPGELAALHADASSIADLFDAESDAFGMNVGAQQVARSGGAQILDLMAAREQNETKGHRTFSLEKAWHGVHYLLYGRSEPDVGPRGAIFGGTEIGGDDFGYGPARYFLPAEVSEIAGELTGAHVEDELRERYEPAELTARHIYPGGWEPDDRAWLLDSYRELRDFFGEAAGRGSAVLTCLV